MKATTHSPSVYWKVVAALWLFLALTWIIGYVDLGPFNLIIALTIAIAKALLVMMFFMHIKGSSRLLHLAASAGVLWLLILIVLAFADYRTRY
jgi:cytochrome c oxidase subunit IV